MYFYMTTAIRQKKTYKDNVKKITKFYIYNIASSSCETISI